MILVDTNVWSEIAKPEPAKAVLDWEAAHSPWLWLSTVVLAEWRAGAALMPQSNAREVLTRIIETVALAYQDRLLPFDEPCSRFYGLVLAEARAAGKPIQTADAMIAATARAHGMKVATRNANDFAGAGVELIDPWNP
ncbi:MAG: type II toxin-antitoxin system VapC family toxin [Sphingomonadales bacterium]|nr:type II toxin-antitoxin system VapC family toxin [Sphingomonadales bacterium]